VLALSALLAGGADVARAAAPSLFVSFNANRTFSASLADGTPVGTTTGAPTVIPPGAYVMYLNDESGAVMQFDLQGPGVQLDTAMSFGEEAESTFPVTFAPSSTYTFRDDLQPSGAVWAFATSTTAAASPQPGPAPAGTGGLVGSGGSGPRPGGSASGDVVGSAVIPFRGTLVASVGPSGAVRLSSKGRPVTSIVSGRYTIDVHDRSKHGGFTLQEIRKLARTVTTVAFVGTRAVTLTLAPGQWFFYPSFVGRKTYFIVHG
jgi:hypothetical protein